MTTFTIPGIFYQTAQDNDQNTIFLRQSSLSFVMAPGKSAISYVYEGPQTGEPTTIVLDNLGTDVYGGVLDGYGHGMEINGDAVMLEARWNDGGTTRTSYVLAFDDGFGGDYIFQVGGYPLPSFASTQDWDLFDNTMLLSATDVPASSPFGAGKPISLTAIPGIMSTEDDYIYGTNGDDVLLGGPGNDYIVGYDGDDLINPGDNTFDDSVAPGHGNDTVDMSDIVTGYVGIDHYEVGAGIDVTIDGNANTGTIDKGPNGTTTLINVQKPILTGADIGGLGIYGSQFDDTFVVRSADGGWLQLRGYLGNDSYTILPSQGDLRLDFHYTNQGMVADFTTGTITNDGWGFTDTIVGFDHVTEVRATPNTDSLVGTDSDYESWILMGGDDTLDAGGGWDRLRFDRDGVESVIVDLEMGTAIGTWDYTPFGYTLSGIEEVRGSNNGSDWLSGDAFANLINGYGGDDIIEGRGGNDTLKGGVGVDTVLINDDVGNITVAAGADGLTVTSADGVDLIANDVEFIQFVDAMFQPTTLLSYGELAALGGGIPGNGPNDDFIVGTEGPDTRDGGIGNDTIIGLGGNDMLIGGPGNDSLMGGDGVDTLLGGGGDDFLSPGTNEAYDDVLDPGTGNDTIDATGIGEGFMTVMHKGVTGPLTIDVDYISNTATIDKGANGVTTIVNIQEPASAEGIAIFGSAQNDVFNINVSQTEWSWFGLTGGAGNDIFNLTGGIYGHGSTFRLDYRRDHNGDAPTQGLVANLETGLIANDGTGGQDTLNRNGLIQIELRGTDNNDSIIGSSGDDRFILEGGNDTLDAGAGFDLLRFDRSGMTSVNVDLVAGTATGIYNGAAFSHQISGIEEVRGTRSGDDMLFGDTNDNALFGFGGDDTFKSIGGFDFINGGDGFDTVLFDVVQSDAFVIDRGDGAWLVQYVGGVAEIANVENLVFDGEDYVAGPPQLPGTLIWGFTSGDPHLQTLDGVGYDFHAVGEFVLLREVGVPGGFELQARFAPLSGVDNVSVNQAFALRLQGGNVQFDAADAQILSVNGFANTIADGGTLDLGPDRIYREGDTYTVVLAGDDGVIGNTDSRVAITDAGGRLDLAVYMGDDLGGRLEGLLGDGDGNPANDVALADGTVLERPLAFEDLYGQYRDDWRVDDAGQSLFTYDAGETLEGFYDASAPGQSVRSSDFSASEQGAAQDAAAAAGLKPGTSNYDNAVLDFLLTGGDQSFVQSAVTVPQNDAVEVAGTMAAGEVRAGLNITVTDLQDDLVSDARVGFSLSGSTAIQRATFDADDDSFKVKAIGGSDGRADGSWAYDEARDPEITAEDALNVLRMAVGLDPTWGEADGFDFIAADINRDNTVTAQDALEILRYAVGLDVDDMPRWVTLDAGADLSGMSTDDVSYETGATITDLADDTTVNLHAILLGNMEDSLL